MNTLDDYEEGTFTPTIESDGGTATGQTYTTQAGHYTKVGNVVSIQFRCVMSVKGTIPAGNLEIKGLPFAFKSGNLSYASMSVIFQGLNTNWIAVQGLLSDNGTNFFVVGRASAGVSYTNLADTDVANGTALAGSVTYFAA